MDKVIPIIAIVGNGLLFILICIMTYWLFRCVKENKVVAVVSEALKKGEKLRRQSEEEYAIMYGNKDKTNLLYRFDLMLEQSGIKNWSKYITTEFVGVLLLLVALLAFILTTMFTSSFLLGVAASAVVIFTVVVGIHILIDIRYEKINQSMLQMFDVLENHCYVDDDIVSIIGKSYVYLPEPLRSCLKKCYDEAILTGDKTSAFRKAELSSPHEKLRDFLRNIEMCSRHTCNYKEIIDDSRSTFKVYLAGKDERRSMLYGEGIDILMIVCVCVLFIGMIYTQAKIDIVDMLFNSLFGNAMLVYWVITIGYGVYSIIKASRR